MTDPIYGDPPLSPGDAWDLTMRPPLVNDPEMQAWRAVVVAAVGEILLSSWLVRWRTKSPVTAKGVHLDAFGDALQFPRPDGWTEERYQPVVVALDGASFTNKPPAVTAAISGSLVNGAQTWEMSRPAPLTYVVVFYSLTADEAILYRAVLERGRPKGVRMVLVYSEVPKANTFVLDQSLLDGPDLLASIA